MVAVASGLALLVALVLVPYLAFRVADEERAAPRTPRLATTCPWPSHATTHGATFLPREEVLAAARLEAHTACRAPLHSPVASLDATGAVIVDAASCPGPLFVSRRNATGLGMDMVDAAAEGLLEEVHGRRIVQAQPGVEWAFVMCEREEEDGRRVNMTTLATGVVVNDSAVSAARERGYERWCQAPLAKLCEDVVLGVAVEAQRATRAKFTHEVAVARHRARQAVEAVRVANGEAGQ